MDVLLIQWFRIAVHKKSREDVKNTKHPKSCKKIMRERVSEDKPSLELSWNAKQTGNNK